MDTLHIFVGYDPREAVAYHVFCNSVIRNCSKPVAFHPVSLKSVKDVYQEIHSTGTGLTQTEPTNQFIFSRFLVPYLMNYSNQPALFVDGDMIVREGYDIAELFDLYDPTKAVQVVKHDYKTKSKKKYLNQENMDYPRKNWSSVILFNCGHYANRKLTPEAVQNSTGAYLHRFEWIDNEHHIGELPVYWNWLPDEFGENNAARLIHHTIGTPCFLDKQYSLAPMAAEWHRERMLTDYSMQTYQP